MMIRRGSILLAAGCLIAAASAPATATTILFNFSDYGTTVASGSFSYATGKTGVIGYADLTSFTLNVSFGHTYTLSEVLGLTDYVQFAYDTNSNRLLSDTNSCGFSGCGYTTILSAVSSDGSTGFFFSPYVFAQQSDWEDFTQGYDRHFDELVLTMGVDQPLPEPASWAMMLLGFGGIGFAMRRNTAGLWRARQESNLRPHA